MQVPHTTQQNVLRTDPWQRISQTGPGVPEKQPAFVSSMALIASIPMGFTSWEKSEPKFVRHGSKQLTSFFISASHLVSLSLSHNGGFVSLRKRKEKK